MAKKTQKLVTKNQIFRALGLTAKMKGANCGGAWFADLHSYLRNWLTGLYPVFRLFKSE